MAELNTMGPPVLQRMASVVLTEPPAVTTLKHELLLSAIDKSPRVRTDLDLLVITQYLSQLESLRHVSSQVLHYLATECTSMTLRDGDVFCYQEDRVVDDSNAIVIIEGSLCGYFNKPFSQRDDTTELFTAWNARQNRKRGVLVDFGEFQTTYGAGALCGFDDLLVSMPTSASSSSDVTWYRRKGIHAQEQTRAISVKKDTLDRAAQRFGLAVERGVHHCQREAPATDLSHFAVFSTLSESARQTLLQHAPRRLVRRGEALFRPVSQGDSGTTLDSIVIVLSGRLDVYWTGEHAKDPERNQAMTPDPDSAQTKPTPVAPVVTTTTPLYSIRRGQTIGDQSVGLALDQLFATSSAHATMHSLPIRLVSGEDTTEVLVISLALYKETCIEDHTVNDYAAQLQYQRQQSTAPLFSAWAHAFFAAKPPHERSLLDVHQLTWRLRVDPDVSKALFQFPPLVLERLCHVMRLAEYPASSPSLVLDDSSDPDGAFIVVHGALRSEAAPDGTRETYMPGDFLGLHARAPAAVVADPGTSFLTIPRTCVERWLQPVKGDLITNAGSLFHRHALFIAAHPPRHALGPEKRKSLSSPTRRGSSRAINFVDGPTSEPTASHTEALVTLLQRMGVLATVPHFVVRELLRECAVVSKPAGQIVWHENEPATSLVVVLSGFLRVFSLEHMGPTIDMFRHHAFCRFSSLHHVLTKQQSQLDEVAENGRSPMSRGGDVAALTRHRSAMYGVHLQTLHALNAFRTGVLQGQTQCPATIVAQTPCVLLLLDEAAYTQILKKHAPAIDMTPYTQTIDEVPTHPLTFAGGRTLPSKLVPQPLLRHLETVPTPLSWLALLSSAKRQLVLRQAKLLVLAPGDRVLRAGDIVDHVFIVVAGALALYVRQEHEGVANALNASQRSVRSLMLERHVTSNYSTTSHQLSSLDDASSGRKRVALQHKVHRMVSAAPNGDHSTSSTLPANARPSLFVQSVVAAVRNEKRKSLEAAGAPEAPTSPRKGVDFHAAVTRATLAHRLDQRRSSGGQGKSPPKPSDDDADETLSASTSTLLCFLRPGDGYGDEALSSIVFRSPHDVFADASSVVPASGSTSALPPATTTPVIEVLCLDRTAFLSVLQKTDDQVDQELRGRSRAAKSKWHLAEQIVTQKRASTKKTPKLFDLFKNILNQRYYITMRAIAAIPLLSDVSDATKREICAGARFEAVERFTNVYKDDSRKAPVGATQLRYYFVLSGRIGLFTRSAIHSNMGTTTGATSPLNPTAASKHGSVSMPTSPSLAAMNASNQYMGLSSSMEACLQEVSAGRGFGEFEILVADASRHNILAIALETTKLLSLPSDLFVKCWPQVAEMERHIAYIRSGVVSFFARLEIEKVASLYHALKNETHERGARILEQQQPLAKSEVVFVKDGECSIKNTITIQALTEQDEPTAAPETTTPSRHNRDKTVRVLATIADVCRGHVFWLGGPGVVPFSLFATSSHVAIARISVDKLRLVLPKAHLAQLEECSNTLATLQREQLANARQTILRVMNLKRSAELGRPDGSFLPSLHFQMQKANKKTQLQSLVASKSRPQKTLNHHSPTKDADDVRHEPPAIPFARVLASKPVDLVHVDADERAVRRQQVAETDVEELVPHPDTELDVAYRVAHEHEHYDLGDVATVSPVVTSLRGSFPDDPTLRRRLHRLSHDTSHNGDSLALLVDMPAPLKTDELIGAETTAVAPTVAQMQLQVTLPSAAIRVSSGRARPSPQSTVSAATPPCEPKPATLSVEYYGDPAEWEELFGRDGADFAVDLRATLRAELQSPLSPLRAMKLEPSGSKLHSMGKYVCVDERISQKPMRPSASRRVIAPLSSPRIVPSGWNAKPQTHDKPTRPQLPSRAFVTHKRGFLHVLSVPPDARGAGFVQDQFLRTVVHRQKRRLVVLEDAVLYEYSDDTDVVETSRVLRTTRLTLAHLGDAPVGPPGENEVPLRQSFLLTMSSGDVVLLTCESQVDKNAWVHAIRSATALGAPLPLVAAAVHAENGSPGSPQFKHRESVAASLAMRETRRISMAVAASGRNAIVQEDVLEVEYRIT